MSVTQPTRSLARAPLWTVLCALSFLGLVGCKGEKPGAPDMSMSGRDLAMAASCEDAKCESPDAKCCNGEPCVDTSANVLNCGTCGKVCRARELCSKGSCTCMGGGKPSTCAASAQCCSDGCHDTMTEVTNCGGCGLPCKMGEACLSGKCSCGPAGVACRTGQACCGTGCADLQNDAKNCGVCGKTCAAGKACKNGICEGECIPCGPKETCCSGICIDLRAGDNKNCGMCGHRCTIFPWICAIDICLPLPDDGGMDGGAADMSMPHD